jgi:hypothetical protein
VQGGVQLPLPGVTQGNQSFFVWFPMHSDHAYAYEQATLQGSIILPRSTKCLWVAQGLVLYRKLARASVSLPTRATEVANVAAAINQCDLERCEDIASQCHCFLKEVLLLV